ncbi:CHAP domain-containing protein [Thioclava sp. SK-1]|uniref:CHAP domain-containing protein n=1 Tax=Thioclava sp. SK-1 TaxID=1889770 RepID=UPI0008260CD9|nr:CHAP domain-containing protein [Thioclava sp. SK-1]OCX60000.1 CHAP domain-containing protein [Thioclava sp. SK-1]
MSVKFAMTSFRGLLLACATMLTLTACSKAPDGRMGSMSFAPEHARPAGLDNERKQYAIRTALEMDARGQRVWCVPFARNASGVEIRGNARTWWRSAQGVYPQRNTPAEGAVMVFQGTRKMPMGHVAVVSKVVSERIIQIDHANWKRNKVSLGMEVMDVSENNDWSAVRVKSNAQSYGSTYPIYGFILPLAQG